MNEEQETKPVDEKVEKRKKNIWLELFRFVLVGGGATLIDFVCEWAIFALIGDSLSAAWKNAIAVTVGFIVSTIFNYLLSLIWVFKNVKDEKKARSKSYALYFVILSAIGLGIGIGLQELGQVTCMSSFSIDISSISFKNVFSQNSNAFWAFTVVFVLKTMVTMVYNYLTRKLILFKAPKDEKNKPAN